MKELDAVVLTKDLAKGSIFDDVRGEGVRAGAFGCVVHRYGDGAAYIVEFFDQGETVAVAEVSADQIRAATQQELAARRIPA